SVPRAASSAMTVPSGVARYSVPSTSSGVASKRGRPCSRSPVRYTQATRRSRTVARVIRAGGESRLPPGAWPEAAQGGGIRRAALGAAEAVQRAAPLGAAPPVHQVPALGDGHAHDRAARGEATVGAAATIGEQPGGKGGGGHAQMSPPRAVPASGDRDVVPP